MKVIGNGDGCYICEIQHTELEKYLNRYYGRLNLLHIGEEIDLAREYQLSELAKEQYNRTKELIETNKKVLEWYREE